MTTGKVTCLLCWLCCGFFPPRRFATPCTCEQTLKAKTQERGWCEQPDLKDAECDCFGDFIYFAALLQGCAAVQLKPWPEVQLHFKPLV